MTTRVIRDLTGRLKRKLEREHDRLATGAPCVLDVIPETNLKRTHDDANIRNQSVRLKQKVNKIN